VSTSHAYLAAILAFAGVVVTACVTIIGLIVTRQANYRMERRLSQEHESEARRLKLDAAMRAGALISPMPDATVERASVASGLLALTQLGQADLAVALLVDLWTKEYSAISNETAVLVIDAGLRQSSSPNAQLVAAEVLCRNACRLDSCQSLHWPSVIDGGWDTKFGPKTKLLLLDALLSMSLAAPANENSLRSLAVRLYGVAQGDEDPRVRACVGRLISALLPSLQRLGYSDFMQGNQRVLLHQLKEAAQRASRNPDLFLNRMVEAKETCLSQWAERCSSIQIYPGSMASTTTR